MRHEYDSNGNHRLVNTETGETGEWATYKGFAILDNYRAVTDYYGFGEGSAFPSEIFLVCKSQYS